MFNKETENVNTTLETNRKIYFDDLKEMRKNQAIRFLDMQNVVNAKLAGSQQSVNNAENYPSTWTTNPDGGANGQV